MLKNKTIYIILLALLAGLSLGACAPQPTAVTVPDTPAPQVITDGLGKQFTLQTPYQKVVSLAPSNTEILYAVGAGSQVVRQAIERYQPLLSLHGHIHESRGVIKMGRTTAINPGSEYGEGILRGVIVAISGDQIESSQMTSG